MKFCEIYNLPPQKISMKIGYVRVSKEEEHEQLQLDALNKYGCDKIYQEKVSGVSKVRPEFERLKEVLRKGDELVVWDIDRLGRTRTTFELIMCVDELNHKGILFKSLSQSLIDTTTETGEFVFKLFALLAEHERKRLIRRTKAGQEAAHAKEEEWVGDQKDYHHIIKKLLQW